VSAQPCRSCGRIRPDGCKPDCPELRWPDGRLRGIGPDLPLPPFNPDRVVGPRYWSPLSEMLAGIFDGAAEHNLAAHLADVESRTETEP
jgi:hypothetical protein